MITLISQHETLERLASLVRQHRLAANLTQGELSARANVPLATLRKFEGTGKISLEAFVKLAFVLGLHARLLEALRPNEARPTSLDDLLKDTPPPRKRASSKGKKA